MRHFLKISMIFLAVSLAIFAVSCDNKLDNQIIINTHIDFTILPNSLEYQELNTVGGYMYLTGSGDSYGIIVYRYQENEFMAYDRKPFYNKNCPNNRLYVNFPFIVDDCNNWEYNIINGYNMSGDGTHIYWYQTVFDGTTLRVHN